jgi:pimeloyl-ACP methyl ester carboxylesterase
LSGEPNAIPLILNHGWPGSFAEFIPVIDSLTAAASTSSGKPVSFDVVIPSLPGFTFSSPPPANWTVDDTARVFNTLMTDVLGYETYAVHGTDWGCGVAYSLYDNFNATVRALHLNFLPFSPPAVDQLAADNVTLTSDEQFQEERQIAWNTTGNAYFIEQGTKVRVR